MEYFNNKWLPDYVFTKKFESYLFMYHPEFFGDADIFIEEYISILKTLVKDGFTAWEVVPKTNEVKILKEYDIIKLNTAQIYEDLFRSDFGYDFGPGVSYLSDVVGRVYLTVLGNPLCIYLERDLEAVIVACSEEISKVFMEKKDALNILTLEEFVTFIDKFYKRDRDKERFNDIKLKLLENYS